MPSSAPITVHFSEPPVSRQTAGLHTAIQGMRTALARSGVAIVDQALPETPGNHLVHFHGLWQPAQARLSHHCRARGVPYLISTHGMLDPWIWRRQWWKKWPYFQLIEKRHLKGAAALLAIGPGEADRLNRFAPRQRRDWLPHGLNGEAQPDYIHARQQLGWTPEEQILLFQSQLDPSKGPDLLLRTLASMKWPVVTRLVIIGDGDLGFVAGLKRFAGEHAEKLPRIDWARTAASELRWRYFQGADLLCLPARFEPHGLEVLDACQVGTPVLTTEECPISGELPSRHCSIATPQIESLRGHLTQFFATPRQTTEQRAELTAWASEQFHWNHLAPRYRALYESLLHTASPTSP